MKIKDQQSEIREKIDLLKKRNQQVIDEQAWLKRFEQSRKKIEKRLGELTREEKREIIRAMITRIRVRYEATESFEWQAEGVFSLVNTGFLSGTIIRSDRIYPIASHYSPSIKYRIYSIDNNIEIISAV